MSDPVAPPPPPPTARILERGYRRYDGERLGRLAAMRAVWWHSIQRMLGIRRPVWAKLLPAAVIFISYVPAIVFVGAVALAGNDPDVARSLPTYADYYGYVSLAVLLFAAFSAPDVLCPDRRTGMLGIYLASPLDRDTYLIAKAVTILTGLLLVTAGPQLLFLTANTMQGHGVHGGDVPLMVVRILGAGLAVALLFTAVTMVISSFTDRRGFASAGIVLVLFASGAIASSLEDAHPTLALVGLAVQLPEQMTTQVFGVVGTRPDVSGIAVWAVAALIVVGCTVVTRVRYARLQVTR